MIPNNNPNICAIFDVPATSDRVRRRAFIPVVAFDAGGYALIPGVSGRLVSARSHGSSSLGRFAGLTGYTDRIERWDAEQAIS